MTYSQFKNKRDFTGVWIPREIWLHPHLLPLEKLLWGEVKSLFNREKGGCFASNLYLAKFFKVSERYIIEMLSKLKKFGLVKEISFNGRQRIIAALDPIQDLSLEEPEECESDRNCSSPETRTVVQGRSEPQFTPLYIDDNKDYNKEETSLKVPKEPEKKSSPVSEKGKELAVHAIERLSSGNPSYKKGHLPSVAKEMSDLLQECNVTFEIAKSVFDWTFDDHFWNPHLYKKRNVGSYFRKEFSRFYALMNAPSQKKPRRYAEGSDMERMKKSLDEWNEGAVS